MMRTQEDILELVIDIARKNDLVRAVLLSGSRADTQSRTDVFQDFDIVYFATAISPFTDDHGWIDCFGSRAILQMPEEMQDPPPANNGHFGYLIQLMDGYRIDLTLAPVQDARMFDHTLGRVLLDKSGLLQSLTLTDHYDAPLAPSAKLFSDCCNEFWWVCLNGAKGLWRGEVCYAKHMIDVVCREQLMKMLDWFVEGTYEGRRHMGKLGRDAPACLEPALLDLLMGTYADSDIARSWQAFDRMCELFRLVSKQVGGIYGFVYPLQEDENVTAYMRHVQILPRTASAIYS